MLSRRPEESVYELSADGKYVYFGMYPQSIKDESVTIASETPDADGYYLGSDGAKYLKHTFVIDEDVMGYTTQQIYDFEFTKTSNGTIMQDGQDYYFKMEKLKWRILSQKDGSALIVCDNVVYATLYQPNHAFDSNNYKHYLTDAEGNFIYGEDGTTKLYANNYKYSELRRFLVNDFYNTAFSTEEKRIIKLTEVDNSASTTAIPTNPYICENTSDYVFALSYADFINTEYGFNATLNSRDFSRSWYNTDYAKATGAISLTEAYCVNSLGFEIGSDNYSVYTPYFDTTTMWLRSPDGYSIGNMVYAVSNGIPMNNRCIVYDTLNGALPALRIAL